METACGLCWSSVIQCRALRHSSRNHSYLMLMQTRKNRIAQFNWFQTTHVTVIVYLYRMFIWLLKTHWQACKGQQRSSYSFKQNNYTVKPLRCVGFIWHDSNPSDDNQNCICQPIYWMTYVKTLLNRGRRCYVLAYLPFVPHNCVSESGQHWFR